VPIPSFLLSLPLSLSPSLPLSLSPSLSTLRSSQHFTHLSLGQIGDFGLCIQSKDWDEEEGDREYLAEELLRCEASSAADMFAAGLITFQMLGGIIKLPGNGDDWHNLREERVTIADHCDAEGFGMAQIAQEMIRKNPKARPSANQVLATEEFCGVPQSPLMRHLPPLVSASDAPSMPNHQQVPPQLKWVQRGSFVQSFKSLDVMDVINCSREEEDDDEMDED
jgi:serine/threonine protein kinase